MFSLSPLAAVARSAVSSRSAALPRSTPSFLAAARLPPSSRLYSTAKAAEAAPAEGEAAKADADPHAELLAQLEAKNKNIAELKVSRLRLALCSHH